MFLVRSKMQLLTVCVAIPDEFAAAASKKFRLWTPHCMALDTIECVVTFRRDQRTTTTITCHRRADAVHRNTDYE
jgi:hypothetical protein